MAAVISGPTPLENSSIANSRWFEAVAGREIAAIAVQVVAAVQARGRELDLWETVRALLAELSDT